MSSFKEKLAMFNSGKKNNDNNQKEIKEVKKPIQIPKESNAINKNQSKEISNSSIIKKENIVKTPNNQLVNGGSQNKVLNNNGKSSTIINNSPNNNSNTFKKEDIKSSSNLNQKDIIKNNSNSTQKNDSKEKKGKNENGKNNVLMTKEEKMQNGSNQKSKEINVNNDLSFQISESSKIGRLINGKHPIYGCVKIEAIKGRTAKLELYNYPLNIEYSSKEESISILFVGQSGTGKSTFINAYVNHLLGITSKDSIRYKLIFGDESKVKDQTQSQTDFITIYNIRSLKYNNKLFKLIDTPGAGDTRNDNDSQLSKLEKDKKEKEFLGMYQNLFSKEIGQLNSIVFVVKSSENRENEFQKRVVKNITDLFADDIGQNCLAILTHTDNDEIIPDAVQLLEKMDIFKKKSKTNEEWYFPVSSPSYFIPFKEGTHSTTESMFNFTELSFKNFTKNLLNLKVYYTKETKRNLELKNMQENIIKILKNNILINLLSNIKKLKENENSLKIKLAECEKQKEEIEKIKKQITDEQEIKAEIQKNFEIHENLKNQKLEELKKNKEKIEAYNKKKVELEKGIGDLEEKQKKAEEEKKIAEEKQNKLQGDIAQLEKKIKDRQTQIQKKQNETQETEEMKKLKSNLENSKTNIQNLEKEITLKKQVKEADEMIKLKNSLAEKEKKMNEIDNEIKRKKNQGETEEMKKIKKFIRRVKEKL